MADCVAVPGEAEGVITNVLEPMTPADCVGVGGSCDGDRVAVRSSLNVPPEVDLDAVAVPLDRERERVEVDSSEGVTDDVCDAVSFVGDGTCDNVVEIEGVKVGVWEPVGERVTVCSFVGEGSDIVAEDDFVKVFSLLGDGVAEFDCESSGVGVSDGVLRDTESDADSVTSGDGVGVGVLENVRDPVTEA